ncbi:DEAD/DEAH box helicase [Aestuariivirga sp.]|uniref:DEAD/DEAH box helicase n=1 Tax=Aestuariivirga sp. TaxID=2650926 RepID=UPI0025C5419F|nr:DEAD/DEAH box helicase [Aestuariivirga sp.]MCA3554483.1 DEAD/DEAH box helicase [Aestuariivirga sp.]
MNFSELGLSPRTLEAVAAAGYTTPTPIQAEAIPPALQRRDVMGLAQTGSGKTAAFVLPMLSLLEKGRARARMPRTLILEPTRELADQVREAFETLGKLHNLSVALLIGGVAFEPQALKIDRGADVVIATPGRLLDHFERGKLLLTGIGMLVIDEADRMLDMGFIPDIERICKLLPFTRQTMFFSATMPPEIQRLTTAFLHNPVRVEVSRPSSTAETITQMLVRAPHDMKAKREALRQLLRTQTNVRNGIIFANRKTTVALLEKSLAVHGFSVGALHGDMDQQARLRTLAGFRNNEITYLIASDVAARGLDIPDVSHVFNFDVPTHAEDYVHRIGRTGRAGREGAAFTMVSKEDGKNLKAIEQLIKKDVPYFELSAEAEAAIETRAAEPDRHAAREGRGGDRGRGRERDRDRRPREVKDHGERAAMEPARRAGHSEGAPAPRAERAPREARPEREVSEPRRERSSEAAQKPTASAAPPRGGKPRRDREPRNDRHPQRDVSDAPDHRSFTEQTMPAFLMRSVKAE